MKRIFCDILISFLAMFFLLGTTTLGRERVRATKTKVTPATTDTFNKRIQHLYQNIDASSYGLSYDAFSYAMVGYNRMKTGKKLKNDKVITIIDFTKKSCQKRFYTIDLKQQRILYHTLVSHGKKSGNNTCSRFSDIPESHQSSIGFYTTGEVYLGKHGKSLRLHGNEKGYNANAYKRAVVIHGADYVSEKFIRNYGRLGRSYGCPALPFGIHKQVINTIKGGSLIFAYYNDTHYLRTSKLLRNTQNLTLGYS